MPLQPLLAYFDLSLWARCSGGGTLDPGPLFPSNDRARWHYPGATARSRRRDRRAVTLASDNRLLAQALAKRGYLDVLKRRVPLYRLNVLGREALHL